jgi:hypothetical protein
VTPDTPSRGAQLVLAWLNANAEQTASVMFDAVKLSTPRVIAEMEDGERLLRLALKSHVPLLSSIIKRGDSKPDVTLPVPAERWARAVAQARIDVSELIMAYDAAGDAIVRSFIAGLHGSAALTDAARADAMESSFEWLFRYLRIVMAKAVAAYGDEDELFRSRTASNVKHAIAQILEGATETAELEHVLNYRLSGIHVGLVIWGDASTVHELDRVVSYFRAAARGDQHLAMYADHRLLHGWIRVREFRLDTATIDVQIPDGVRVALGSPHAGADGFRLTHREACLARRFAELEPHAAKPVVHYPDVALTAMTAHDHELVRSFVLGQLGPLLNQEHRTLLRTLQVWLEQLGSPTRTARVLNLHTNSVVKRLERAESLLGATLDPSSLALRVAVELAPALEADLS